MHETSPLLGSPRPSSPPSPPPHSSLIPLPCRIARHLLFHPHGGFILPRRAPTATPREQPMPSRLEPRQNRPHSVQTGLPQWLPLHRRGYRGYLGSISSGIIIARSYEAD
ncbi:hypothetical protein BO70DRAFT_178871 [Aspergillus heteromorphus CBS 117.55]|uniref:Uncharacterized protein n=1 Tax=Aspergillus heteromorphus CBS 117.55 TaxID=1448321 RepID=A0A317WPC6_9EURO|nr:uncharacterized protein BO70DRAFT_178871 [Aspergillus heteromorphus CBS 117.55]PWY88306.1 hypothetical protein BO70DRAFT_178871 [Aspergillus heteromorphus CBS 117.55]